MKVLGAVLLACSFGLSACAYVHPVSSFHATNVEGAPGTAGDLTTGGQGNDARGDNER